MCWRWLHPNNIDVPCILIPIHWREKHEEKNVVKQHWGFSTLTPSLWAAAKHVATLWLLRKRWVLRCIPPGSVVLASCPWKKSQEWISFEMKNHWYLGFPGKKTNIFLLIGSFWRKRKARTNFTSLENPGVKVWPDLHLYSKTSNLESVAQQINKDIFLSYVSW